MNRTQRITVAVTAVFVLTIVGCGYRFSPGGEHIDSRITTVYVDVFSNPTDEAYVENYIRNAFTEQFRKSRRFTLSGNRNECDAVISGRILTLRASHVSYTESNIAKEDWIVMTLEAIFKERTGKVIWENKNLSGREAYRITGDTDRTDTHKNHAIKKLTSDLAEEAYRSIMSGF